MHCHFVMVKTRSLTLSPIRLSRDKFLTTTNRSGDVQSCLSDTLTTVHKCVPCPVTLFTSNLLTYNFPTILLR